ncbi:ABC transporter permease [Capillimicrobium parvum]|uniref:Transport permease protein n=1 Tax=Capillimicrobium parvum TaxID=2884022 RepID=A0A9E6XSJ1_9ACTN|nr:ABC transporter permease [Capillimicrobium parvum]UGS33918.1 Daunorubicin/doxorubicin resistance ABC transporter permease protein DrrB [Capillimicrobium parvum]
MAALSDALLLAQRNLRRIPRNPDLLVGVTFQPIMFVVLFTYVFGGAISTPGFDYIDFFLPGIIVQMIAFTGYATALGISDDLRKGLIDRFRSLPMARSAVLAGRTLSDVSMNVIALVTMLIVGFIVGFSFDATAGKIAAGVGLVLLFGYAMSWVYCFFGLIASSPESASAMITIVIFPLTFVSSAYVPTDSMPKVLAAIANANPITTVVDALRSLWLGTPAGTDVGFALLWCVGIAAVFAVLATARYRRTVAR